MNSIGELVPPGTSPVAPKSPDVDVAMPQFPANRRESNEMSLEEEQLAGVKKGLLKLYRSSTLQVFRLSYKCMIPMSRFVHVKMYVWL